jgi:hypothetical protein
MHMQELPAAGPLVQIVNILRNEKDRARPFTLQPGEGEMAPIGRD